MSLRSLASPWSLVLLSALAGCGDTTAPPPAADMSVSVSDASIDLARPPAGCTSNAMCMGDTPRCDMATGKCVACLEDGHCPEASVCRGGACTPGCSAMKGCGDAGTCDVDAGACKSCGADADCTDPANPRCDVAKRACVPCLPDKDNCPMGKACVKMNDTYTCAAGCKDDADCKGDGGELGIRCCAGACIDTTKDNANCGACGTACAMGKSCCGSMCADVTVDVANCGGCGKACQQPFATPACMNSTCAIAACDKGYADCDKDAANGCEANTDGDPKNCTACGMACNLANATAGCQGGCTVAACTMGFGDCDKVAANGCEVDLAGDVKNCGACGNACPAPANGTAACVMGKCVVGGCSGAFLDCDKDPANGCEVNGAGDAKNCGACGTACGNVANGVPGCLMGKCGVGSCNGGFGDCDMNPANGCETATAADLKNCGGCGKVCPVPPNGNPTCAAGACNSMCSCQMGFANCDGDCQNGCESRLATDPKHCGACGKACPVPANTAGATCVASVCNPTCSCNLGFNDCDKNCANGCEINLIVDVKNCGACGTACPAVANGLPGCAVGKCGVGSCNAGFADCDKAAGNGCEVTLANDAKNCGACGTACPAAQRCLAGKCVEQPSCKALLAGNPNAASGLYTIDPDGPGGANPFSAYCEMKADGGGWTLVLKIDGTKATFTYDAPLWTDKNLLAADKPDLDRLEAKLPGFLSVPYTALRLGMIDGGNTRWLVVPTTAGSLYAAINGNYLATAVGRDAWKSLLATPSLQRNCNKEGINAFGPFGNPWPRVRIGIVSNQENDCGTPDSWIGFGGYGAPCGPDANPSCGNVAGCSPDNGDRAVRTFGYVMVR